MGQIDYTRECGPDGSTIVTVHASNGYLTVYIDGIQGHELVTGPGSHTVQWWGYPTSNGVRVPGPDVLWDTKIVTIDARTDCATTTTQGQPTTSEAPSTTTALVPPPSTITPPVSIGLDTTAVVTVPPALPATGVDSDDVALGGGLALALGVVLVLITHRRTQRQIRQLVRARLEE